MGGISFQLSLACVEFEMYVETFQAKAGSQTETCPMCDSVGALGTMLVGMYVILSDKDDVQ